jgi:hypothetical protein
LLLKTRGNFKLIFPRPKQAEKQAKTRLEAASAKESYLLKDRPMAFRPYRKEQLGI